MPKYFGTKKSNRRKSVRKTIKRRSNKLHRVSMKRRLSQVNNPCRKYSKSNCGPVDPNCGWRTRVGCTRKRNAKSMKYEGPSARMV